MENADNRVRMIDRHGIISTVVGTGHAGYSGDGGPATKARLDQPGGMTFDTRGNLYIADTGSSRIRLVGRDGIITTFAP
jgi:hypothetical protein